MTTIEEYGSCLVTLDPRDYRSLCARYRGRLHFAPTDTLGRYTLTARGYVGRVRLSPDLLLLITPKVSTPNLLYMLSMAAGGVEFHSPHVKLDTSNDLLSILGAALIAEARKLLQGGLRADFAPHEGDLPLVRGRVLLGRQITHYGDLRHRHICAYAERTPDTPENRILLSALLYLPALFSQHEGHLTKTARALIAAFGGVTRILPSEGAALLRNVRIHRRNIRYSPILSLCALILNHLGITNQAGSRPFPSFLIDMPRLFEQYLTARLVALLPPHGLRVVAQRHDYLDEAGRVRIRPDLLIYPRHGKHPIFVVDAKYRTPRVEGDERSSDLYQLGAYMGRYGLERGALVYPQGETMAPGELRMRGTGESIHLLTLNLSAPTPEELEQSCARIAAEIARLSTR